MKKKNILWIEDFDTKSTKKVKNKKNKINQNNSEVIKNALGIFDEKYQDVIEIKTSLFEGIEHIITHKGEFDCVILDVDMGKNLQIDMDEKKTEGKIWNEFFKHINLKLEEDLEGNKIDYKIGKESANAHLGKNAGFYIVLFLISLGFPKERIIMFTAYGGSDSDNRVSEWEIKFISTSLFIPDVIAKGEGFKYVDKKIHEELNKKLEKLYSQEYYKSRLFLFVIYNMFVSYKGEISRINSEYSKVDKEKYKSIFNYVCKKEIQFVQVEDLIENVLFYFPCVEHNYVKDLNYQALKRFSEPFEADYIGNRIEKYNTYGTYRVMKLYRNWSAHSLFSNPEENCPMNYLGYY